MSLCGGERGGEGLGEYLRGGGEGWGGRRSIVTARKGKKVYDSSTRYPLENTDDLQLGLKPDTQVSQ